MGESIFGCPTICKAMDSYVTFVLVAFACILAGIPLWAAIIAPNEFSLTVFTDAGFWIAAAIGMVLLLFGFWLGKRADIA